MSQIALTLPGPKYGGTELVRDLLKVFQALASNRSGDSRPADVQPAEMWIQTVSAVSWLLNLWDGTQDILVATINPAAHTLTFSVSYAETAGSADTASTADLAANANALGGKSKADILVEAHSSVTETVNTYTKQQYVAPVAVAPVAGVVTLDAELHQDCEITSTAALTMNAPIHAVKGMQIFMRLYAATALAITWNAVFSKNGNDSLPVAHVAGIGLYVSFRYNGTKWVMLGQVPEA